MIAAARRSFWRIWKEMPSEPDECALGVDLVAISAESRWVVTASLDETARLWLLRTNDLVDLDIIGRRMAALFSTREIVDISPAPYCET
jgi:WD40 repeat protein